MQHKTSSRQTEDSCAPGKLYLQNRARKIDLVQGYWLVNFTLEHLRIFSIWLTHEVEGRHSSQSITKPCRFYRLTSLELIYSLYPHTVSLVQAIIIFYQNNYFYQNIEYILSKYFIKIKTTFLVGFPHVFFSILFFTLQASDDFRMQNKSFTFAASPC